MVLHLGQGAALGAAPLRGELLCGGLLCHPCWPEEEPAQPEGVRADSRSAQRHVFLSKVPPVPQNVFGCCTPSSVIAW